MWPMQKDCDTYYGNPRGVNGRPSPAWAAENIYGNDSYIKPPFQMYYGNTPIRGFRVHRRCAESLRRVFQKIWDAADHEQSIVDAWGASKFSGSYVFRNKRGGGTLSMHAYGCAIDLDAARNARGSTRPFFGKEGPNIVVRCFESEGWIWGGRWRGASCDGMHFQAANVYSVTTSQLRVAGSRTIASTDKIQINTAGVGLSSAGAVGLLSTANDAGGQIVSAARTAADGKETAAMLGLSWQVILLLLLLALMGYFLWRTLAENKKIVQARLEDAAEGVPGDQILADNPIEGSVLDGVSF